MGITARGVTLVAQQVAPALKAIGVGNGLTYFTDSQTDLQGSITMRKAIDPSTIVVTDATITASATFEPGEASFEWTEWGAFTEEAGGEMLCRTTTFMGVKTDEQRWTINITLPFISR